MTTNKIRRLAARTLTLVLAGGAILALSGCGTSAITRPRIERALPQAFANLYVQQAKILGRPGITVASLKARAKCDKGAADGSETGPGADWICQMYWNDPAVPLSDGTGRFELNVHSNACYTAGGPSKLLGLLMITDTTGKDVQNPVFEFDGCFDPNGPNTPIPPPANEATLGLPRGLITPTDADGHVEPRLRCSAGATGGCAGLLSARVGSQTVATVRYALPPEGDNTYPLVLSPSQRTAGSKLVLTVNPMMGKTPVRSTTLTVTKP